MPQKKDPPLSPAEQKKRFEALAREVGAQRSGADKLKAVIKKVALSESRRPKTAK